MRVQSGMVGVVDVRHGAEPFGIKVLGGRLVVWAGGLMYRGRWICGEIFGLGNFEGLGGSAFVDGTGTLHDTCSIDLRELIDACMMACFIGIFGCVCAATE